MEHDRADVVKVVVVATGALLWIFLISRVRPEVCRPSESHGVVAVQLLIGIGPVVATWYLAYEADRRSGLARQVVLYAIAIVPTAVLLVWLANGWRRTVSCGA